MCRLLYEKRKERCVMKDRHLIDLDDYSIEEISEILNLADIIMKKPQYFTASCSGRVMATLFYEPSTRTQMSFQTAMLRLGGSIIGFDDPGNSSVSKGETLKDTVRVVSNYADIIAIRHPLEGSAQAAAMYSRVPVINAGDGGHLHPTQTLTDLFTLSKTKGTLSGLCIGLCGDLKFGRTVHSLIKTLCRYPDNEFVLISTKELGLPQYLKDFIVASGHKYSECESLEDAMPSIDVLYMTRIQRERFSSIDEYERQKGVFVLDKEKLKKAKYGLKILHPLPRVDEIAYEVDEDPRAEYFNQTEYGMYARMALILNMLDNGGKKLSSLPESNSDKLCSNEKCITRRETYLPRVYKKAFGRSICKYCEHDNS